MTNCDPEVFYKVMTNMANEPMASYGLILNTFEDLEGHALATIRQEYYPNIPIFSLVHFTSVVLQPVLLQTLKLQNLLLMLAQASDGLIFNTFEDLEETSLAKIRHEYLPNTPIFPIGPFHKYSPSPSSNSLLSQDQSCISWLNTQAPKSVVYVSFGTVAKMEEAQFLEIAWRLCNSDQPFLWVVRPNLVHGSNWLEQLPSGLVEPLNGRGHIVKWAPQNEVLTHPAVGAF
ncbi:hypothetical protein ACFX13_042153 [Malus domestica]